MLRSDPRPLPWWLLASLLGISVAAPAFGQRTYWPVSVDSLATGKVLRTHVEVTGLVTLVRHESDGDTHIKLVGKTGFVVLEIAPGCPLTAIPSVGQHIRAYGITRWDGEHHWAELHILEKWEPAPP